jgi:hypothetical protein
MRQTTKYICKGYRRNQDSLDEVKIESILTTILNYTKKWICHIDRIQEDKFPKLIMMNKKSRGDLCSWGWNGSTDGPPLSQLDILKMKNHSITFIQWTLWPSMQRIFSFSLAGSSANFLHAFYFSHLWVTLNYMNISYTRPQTWFRIYDQVQVPFASHNFYLDLIVLPCGCCLYFLVVKKLVICSGSKLWILHGINIVL